MKPRLPRLIVITILVVASGCQSDNDRLVELSQRQAEREAEHARQLSELQRPLAEGTQRLVESDAASRKELTELQRDLRADQAAVGQQRDALEAERKAIASERYWDSILGATISSAALLLACLLPLILCIVALRGLGDPEQTRETLAEILVEQYVAQRPQFLPPSPAQSAIEGTPSSSARGDDSAPRSV